MRDNLKTLVYDLFQWLIVFSIPFVLCFYWPNHELRLMKFICLQTYATILLSLSFIYFPKRSINNPYPALFLILGFVNLFTHGMSEYVNVGVSFMLPTVVGIYVISNHINEELIPVLKKMLVITCLLNCALFLTQNLGLSIVFNAHQQTAAEPWQQRPSGFMCYPASFALLCAVSLFFAWGWRKLLCIPIGICLLLSKEYSVIGGLLLAISMPFLKKWWHYFALAAFLGVIGYFLWPTIHGKLLLRMKYLYPVIQNVWARPIDGYGVGMYNRLPDSFFGFFRGNWSEMHCEPLDLLLCMGFLGLACIAGWIYKVREMSLKYKMIFVVFGSACLFHSPFHFGDTIWLFVILYSLYEAENYEQSGNN